ncbi:calcium-binding protein [Roseomonas fluvialis]|uniref:calcium-binding protein n=1 Tax=Roseomonas fluvialis TaxID=1750527 RepID=UPI003C6E6E2B
MGADTLTGLTGGDTLDGGAGIDRLVGGADSNIYIVTTGDVVVEGLNQGQDTVIATDGTAHTLAANVEVLVLQGSTLVTGTGNGLANTLVGNALDNVLNGGAGDDSLSGGIGIDTSVGGAGADTMTGCNGADRFRLLSAADRTVAASDRINEFSVVGLDRVDLSFVDANALTPANDAFAFIGTAAFGAAGAAGAASAGQLRVTAASPGVWRAQGDNNGDGVADLQILIAGPGVANAGWFIL